MKNYKSEYVEATMMSQLASHLSGLEGERAKLRAQVMILDIFMSTWFSKGILNFKSTFNRMYTINVA